MCPLALSVFVPSVCAKLISMISYKPLGRSFSEFQLSAVEVKTTWSNRTHWRHWLPVTAHVQFKIALVDKMSSLFVVVVLYVTYDIPTRVKS